MKPFIRIGKLGINVNDIMSYNRDVAIHEPYYDEQDDGWVSGHRCVHMVRLVTREVQENLPLFHDFEHGTPEANALLTWLEAQTEDLLAEEPYELMIAVPEAEREEPCNF